MEKSLPVYQIGHFKGSSNTGEFYANELGPHIRKHDFVLKPHKHDFYLVILFTKGSGTHEIDLVTYPVKPGTLFLMRPGQMHYWNLSKNADGYIFFHDSEFYDQAFSNRTLQTYSFYNLFQSSPIFTPKEKDYQKLLVLFKEIMEEFRGSRDLKFHKLQSLVNLSYIELLRILPQHPVLKHENYLLKLKKFEDHIQEHFKTMKNASGYARLMNMSEKHLNRICKTCLNKTSTELIAERIILEAKRLFNSGEWSVSEVAYSLGYKDQSYFTRFFKKHVRRSPQAFMKDRLP